MCGSCVPGLGLDMAGILVVLMMAVMPALRESVDIRVHGYGVWGTTYNTPQLMAMATPIFSLSFIWSPQMTVHGSNASAMSMAAEYAASQSLVSP